MALCSSCRGGKSECVQESCSSSLPELDSDSDSDSDISDVTTHEPFYPSTLVEFESDLECFKEIFPSVINVIESLGDPIETGWLAGCVHDVILCL